MKQTTMPERGTFFTLLAAHTDRLVAAANAAQRLLAHMEQRTGLIEEVNRNEGSGDQIKADFIHLLYESFTTPINRDQLHTLILDLDRVLNTLQSVANAVTMYNIHHSTPEARSLATLSSEACLKLNRAVIALANRQQMRDIAKLYPQVDELEAQGSAIMQEAVAQLFRAEGDEAAAWNAMKMRRFYLTQVAVLGGCKRAARTLEEILLENA
ncbi:MAG: hypothetical protein RIR79_2306 [Pseudomonadota bacterium]|jgi:uncharacterized protein Yka (UPF0111/DUF47 family)